MTLENFLEDQNIDINLKEIILKYTFAFRRISAKLEMLCFEKLASFTGTNNKNGDKVRKIDAWANDAIIDELSTCSRIACLISEETEEVIKINDNGDYISAFDPLDGSSNVAVNVTSGSIFSIYKRKSSNEEFIKEDDILQNGDSQLAAGYTLYGTATLFILTVGSGVSIFALDKAKGVFVLSKENIQIPETGNIYSCNEGNMYKWDENLRNHIIAKKQNGGINYRYAAAVVADLHRVIRYGGLYLYPKDPSHPDGKLRHLYEANPLSWIVEQAGGMAYTCNKRILDVTPKSIHEHIPFFAGSKNNVEEIKNL